MLVKINVFINVTLRFDANVEIAYLQYVVGV